MRKTILGLIVAFVCSANAFAEPLCVGDTVYGSYAGYSSGKVVGVNGSEFVMVKYPGLSKPIKEEVERLARIFGETQGFRVGDQVLSSNGVYGKIVGVYPGGYVAVDYWGTGVAMIQIPGDLAHTTGSASGFIVGDVVLSLDGNSGKVVGTYNSGNLAVKFENEPAPKQMASAQLMRTDNCATQLCN